MDLKSKIIAEKKAQLELGIKKIIKKEIEDFEKETGLFITDIYLNFIPYTEIGKWYENYYLENVKVNLLFIDEKKYRKLKIT